MEGKIWVFEITKKLKKWGHEKMGSAKEGVRHEYWTFYSISSLPDPPSTDRPGKRPVLSFV